MILIFCSAFIAGLAYCAAPGVINAEGMRRGLNHGFRAAMLFQVGALAGDALWAVVALSGIALLPASVETRLLLGTGGGLLMVWMAWGILCEAWQARVSLALPQRGADLLLGALLSLANPFAIVFWLGMGGGLLLADAPSVSWHTVALVAGAFLLANLLWSVLLAALATYGRSRVQADAFRWINVGAGVCMAFFGLYLCWQTVTALAPLFS